MEEFEKGFFVFVNEIDAEDLEDEQDDVETLRGDSSTFFIGKSYSKLVSELNYLTPIVEENDNIKEKEENENSKDYKMNLINQDDLDIPQMLVCNKMTSYKSANYEEQNEDQQLENEEKNLKTTQDTLDDIFKIGFKKKLKKLEGKSLLIPLGLKPKSEQSLEFKVILIEENSIIDYERINGISKYFNHKMSILQTIPQKKKTREINLLNYCIEKKVLNNILFKEYEYYNKNVLNQRKIAILSSKLNEKMYFYIKNYFSDNFSQNSENFALFEIILDFFLEFFKENKGAKTWGAYKINGFLKLASKRIRIKVKIIFKIYFIHFFRILLKK